MACRSFDARPPSSGTNRLNRTKPETRLEDRDLLPQSTHSVGSRVVRQNDNQIDVRSIRGASACNAAEQDEADQRGMTASFYDGIEAPLASPDWQRASFL